MSGWQLGLRIHSELVGPLQNLLAARAATVSQVDEAPQALDRAFLVAGFGGDVDPIVMDAVGSWLLNLNAADAQIYTRTDSSDAWMEGWSAVLGSFQASTRIWVVPSWDVPPEDAVQVVHLESSLAFGIGGHPTTRGTLNVLDRLLHDDDSVKSVLDVGSGSGILALASGHLGVSALGIEPDETAVAESKRNLERNKLGSLVSFRAGTLREVASPYDVVAANLYPSTIRREREHLLRCTGKHLVLSGFYPDASGEIRAYFPTLDCVESYRCDDWSVLHLKRTSTS